MVAIVPAVAPSPIRRATMVAITTAQRAKNILARVVAVPIISSTETWP
jgi:hypothetical protein